MIPEKQTQCHLGPDRYGIFGADDDTNNWSKIIPISAIYQLILCIFNIR